MNRRNAFKAAIASVIGLVVAPKVAANPIKEDYWIPASPEDDVMIGHHLISAERKVFYIDVPPGKESEFIKKMRENFKKQKLCRK